MVNWKLGTGTNYSNTVGFTWPTNENPKTFSWTIVKKTQKFPMMTRDEVLVYTFGVESVQLSVEGDLTSKANFRTLMNFATKSQEKTSAGGIDYRWSQRLYIDNSTYFIVKNSTFQSTRMGNRPLIWSYIITFELETPQLYDDNVGTYSKSGS